MPVPSPRNKILPARGNFADLSANVASLLDGEICYAIDQDQYYQNESGTLVSVGATKAQGILADSAIQPGDNVSELTNDAGYITLAEVPGDLVTSVAGKTGDVTLVKADVGLGNVDNTSDVNKPISTSTQAALDLKADLVGGFVPTSQIPAIAITEFLGSVGSEAAMLALTGQLGDWCLRTDKAVGYVIVGADPSVIAGWEAFTVPGSAVTSINTQVGDVVLGAADVGAATAAQGALAESALQPGDRINAAAGTAAEPGVYFDANTGLYSPGTDQVAISTNGTGRLFIDSSGTVNIVGAGTAGTTQAVSFNGSAPVNSLVLNSTGNVGIGNGNPINLLDVEGTTPILRVLANGNTASTINLHSRAGATTVGLADIQCSNVGNLLFSTGTTSTTERLRITSAGQLSFIGAGSSGSPAVGFNGSAPSNSLVIDSAGLVGIGTSSPTNLLHVSGTSGTPAIFERTGSNGSFIGLKDGSGSLAYLGNTNGAFSIQTSGSSYSDKLVVTSAGLVGIGTTTVSNAMLQVTSGVAGAAIKSEDTGSTGSFLRILGDASSGNLINWKTGTVLRFATSDDNYGSFSERFRCDSSGRLLVGTSSARANFFNSTATTSFQVEGSGNTDNKISIISSSSSAGAPAAIVIGKQNSGTVGGNTSVTSNTIIGQISFQGNDGSEFVQAALIQADVDGTPGADDMPGRLVFSTTADGASSPTERMRITNAGAIRMGNAVGTTDTPGFGNTTTGTVIRAGGDVFMSCSGAAPLYINRSSTTGTIVSLRYAGTERGTISTDGTVVAYNTSSDYRLKENVAPVTDGITRLQQLKPSRFNFIADPDTTVDGFLAHEVQTVVPEAITGEKDAVDDDGNPVYQGIDQSKLVPLLTAALQEAIGRIETLEAEVAALKAS